MHTNTSASALTKTLKAFQAVMLVMALVTLSFPVTALTARADHENEGDNGNTVNVCKNVGHNPHVSPVSESEVDDYLAQHPGDFLIDGSEGHTESDCVGSGDDQDDDNNDDGDVSCTLTADPSTITAGDETTTLTLHISGEDADNANVDNGVGNVADDGTAVVSPDTTTTYTATVSGGEDDEDPVTCQATVTVDQPQNDTPHATVHASKVVCDSEADLPNWGNGGADITPATAQNWVDQSDGRCHLQEGWKFQYAPGDTANPGDNVEEAGEPWTTFTSSVDIQNPDNGKFWFREEIPSNYIPFSGSIADPRDAVSAEMYCNTDVLNYDNYDWIDPTNADHDYYCVAFNALKEQAPTCNPEINLVANGSFEAPAITDGSGWDIFPTGTSLLVWAADFLDGGAPSTGNVELQKIWAASDGSQYTELDSDWNGHAEGPNGEAGQVEISQDLATVPGQKYHVSFDFSARPGTPATDNSVGVYEDGNPVGIVSAALATAGDATEWSSHGFDFTAGDANTLLALRDVGDTNNSVGTFVDNVKVTCVPDETPTDVCSNIEGDQSETPQGYENNDGICTPIQQCNDDATTTLLSGDMGEGELITAALGHGAAKLVAAPHSAWFAPGLGDGLWIWKDTATSDTDAQNLTSQTFERGFTISGTPLDATLTLAADNTYDVTVNGIEVCSDLGEFNYAATVDCTIPAADMVTGANTLDITVTNKPIENSNGTDNPAGLSYKLVTHDDQCTPPPPTDVCPNIDGNQSVVPEGDVLNNDGQCVPADETPTTTSTTHRNRHNGSGGGNSGEVLGASTCGPLLTTYLHLGWKNDASEVSKLQDFLNTQLGITLPLSGFFGNDTFNAVKAFQLQHGKDVLIPWVGHPDSGITGEDTPTGYVYQTTRWMINNIWCPGSEQFPSTLD